MAEELEKPQPLTPEQHAQNALQEFNITEAAIAEMEATLLAIKVADENDKLGYEHAREQRLMVKEIRVSVEKKRKELKEGALRYGQIIDGYARGIREKLEIIESHLQTQEDIVGQFKKRQEMARLEAERLEREAKQREIEAEAARLAAEREVFDQQRRAFEEAQLAAEAERQPSQTEVVEAVDCIVELVAKDNARPDSDKLLRMVGQLESLDWPDFTSEVAEVAAAKARMLIAQAVATLRSGAGLCQ